MIFNLFELDILLIKIQKANLNAGGYSLKWPIRIKRLHPKEVPFSGFKYMRGLGFHLWKYYERIGKTVISVGKKA